MHFDNPSVEHPALARFALLASEFCELVERRNTIDSLEFMRRLHLIVPRLYADALLLPSTNVLFNEEEGGEEDDGYSASSPDPDRLDVYVSRQLDQSLSTLFGARTYYREVFDPYEPERDNPELVGSLADDVTDIYGDLRRGLLNGSGVKQAPRCGSGGSD